jgi:PqqD family protein of HPr-rel-A system
VQGTRLTWFDGELLVFNPSSWETHLLNEAGASLLARLVAGPRSVGQLQEFFRDAHPNQPAQQCNSAVESLVSNLINLGVLVAKEAE